MMDGYVDAVIRLRVPKWQVGQEAFVYFADTMSVHATCEEPKKGKWMPHPTEADWDVCTACGCGTMRRTHGYDNGAFWDAEESYSYCPWCGARME